jgi:hypothetical protein
VTGSRRRLSWTLPALVLSCGNPPSLVDGVAEDVAFGLWFCERLDRGARDWCAVVTVPTQQGSGVEGMEVCRRLEVREARDRCVELMVRHPVDPAPAETCATISGVGPRSRCWSAAAARLAVDDLDAGVDACLATGAGVVPCLTDIVASREVTWKAVDPEQMGIDLPVIVSAFPAVAHDASFGATVASVASDLGFRPGLASPCDQLGWSTAWSSCVDALAPPMQAKD